ncbi:MAG: NAD-dependent deacetylase [Gemmatimonadales bacterium]
MTQAEHEALHRARALLERAERIVVLTGAGVSAESGVPTFRGPGGLWKTHRPETLATPDAFARDPRLVWEWYAWRRSVVAGCAPNAAHRALARLALRHRDALIVTQNVDGLHHRAADALAAEASARPEGSSSRAYPLEVHGALHRDRCTGCGRRTPGGSVDASSEARLPRCSACGSMLRPDVVWFGESLDPEVLAAAFDAAARADVCLVVGTSAVVYPAAAVPEATLARGGAIVEVNPESTPLTSRAAVSLRGTAADMVPSLVDLGADGG